MDSKNKPKKSKRLKQDKFQDWYADSPSYQRINAGTGMLFEDLTDILETKELDLDSNQKDLLKDLIAFRLHYSYTVVYSPLDECVELM